MSAGGPVPASGGARARFALVFAADEHSALPLAVAMRSALCKLSAAIRPEIYVLDDGLSQLARRRLLTIVAAANRSNDLRWLPVPSEPLANQPSDGRFPAVVYARLLIPRLVAPYIQRAIYLDADVLVREDLSPLFTIALNDRPIGAVRDFLPRPKPYFNSGVLVMDLPCWRSERLGERILEYAVERWALQRREGVAGVSTLATMGLKDPDQDALNGVIESWYELDYKWNVQHGNLFFSGLHGLADCPPATDFTERLYRERWDLYRKAAVLHFVGGVKPWDRLCPLPGTTAWVYTMIRTGWLSRWEAFLWVFGYVRRRTRYWLGTMKGRWQASIVQVLHPSS